ncbi:signal transduction histidine kinase [Desulfofundulus luciae]|uniref:histidine kinase n=1 Tax=Desulfofundulus luciae TaxID=74702 RepID=A0ABU0AX17_9FIRM|nr:HAMP domain-containing sensor histidine kinase [Desulfofundulus luciae]MDQ0285015.1 signal transduction histidine kinase [Desulfofundulus luciae]
MRKWSIFTKILVFGLGIALFTALILSLVLSSLFSYYFYRQYEASLKEDLQEAANLTTKYLQGQMGVNAYHRGMDLITRVGGTNFYLLDAHGAVSFKTEGSSDFAPGQNVLADLVQHARGNQIYTRIVRDQKEHSLDIVVAATRLPEGTIIGFFPVADIREPVREVIRLVWLAALGTFTLAVVPALFFSRHFTRPLVQMSRVALLMGQGDFSARIQVEQERHDEIGQLARALNFMATQLEALERTRQDFLANVSHELRTPLTSIRGFVQGMLDGTIPPAGRPAYLARVFAETGRLAHIVDDLLTLARLKSGHLRFNWEDVCPGTILAEVVEILTPLAVEKKVTLDFSTSVEGYMTLRGDRCRLAQVFTNIIDNAIKFSPENSKVIVRGEWKASGFLVRVTDEGPGIPPAELPYIFERFYTGNLSSDREYPGTGLGLAISKLLVEKHGGKITAGNRPGGGCEFSIFLPARGPQVAA